VRRQFTASASRIAWIDFQQGMAIGSAATLPVPECSWKLGGEAHQRLRVQLMGSRFDWLTSSRATPIEGNSDPGRRFGLHPLAAKQP
jgi:hypothetical protein